MRRKKIIVAVVICLLYVGAYFVGGNHIRPETSPAQTAEQVTANRLAAIETADLTEWTGGNLAEGSAENGAPCPVSFFMSDLQYLDPEETILMLHSCGVQTITVPLVWRFLEPKEGAFDPSEYDALLEPYAAEGFRFVFLIDGGNRQIYNKRRYIGSSLPLWVVYKAETPRMTDFMDRHDRNYGLSYSSKACQEYYLRFCQETVDYFGKRYQNSLAGFAPCVMNEFEIKYPQSHYAFTDYGDEAQSAFRKYLKDRYQSVGEMNQVLGTDYLGITSVTMPAINYNNSISAGQLNDDPLFVDFMRFREQALVDYVTPIYQMIRGKGYPTVAYFCQMLNAHDAIYAAGMATKLADAVDIAVADFNFYNGYGENYDSIVPAMMVNYLHNAGYREVWAGLYFERIPYLEHESLLQETIDYVAADGLAAGYEIGGIGETFRAQGAEAAPDLRYGVGRRTEQAAIAIYASPWNFYKSHGENTRYFDYFSDALSQMYKMIRFELGYPADILCDEAVLNGALERYDLLVLPGQFYVDQPVREAIEKYIAGGGKAMMDYRFGEWQINGTNTMAWSDESFGIAGRMATVAVESRLTPVEGSPVGTLDGFTVRSCYPSVPNLYMVFVSNRVALGGNLFTDENGQPVGGYTDRTVTLGFQPQIQYRYAQSEQESREAVAVIEQSIRYLLENK